MNASPAIRTTGLSKRFGALTAVAGLDLEIGAGELFALVGSDGAGKTTTLRMLAGILDPDGGEAWVLGRQTVRDAEALKSDLGYMSQRFGLYPDLSVEENLRFYADIHGLSRRQREEQLARLLAFSNLAPFRRRLAGHLSGGMQQKLGLACTLLHTPRLLLLDEPTNGVDPLSRREFWRILYRLLSQGTTIVVSTAYLDEAERCHRVGLLHQGRLLACDTPAALRRLVPGELLEVCSSDGRQAARCLRDAFPAARVGLFGDRVHLQEEGATGTAEQVSRCLLATGIEPLSIRRVEPGLEDVFIALLGDGGRHA